MITPSEILYWEILPAIRREIVLCLKKEGLKQAEIAKLLDVTPAAISQYVKSKRGAFEFNDDFKEKIKISADAISSGKDAFSETNKLIKIFEREMHLCDVCSDRNDLNGCKACFND